MKLLEVHHDKRESKLNVTDFSINRTSTGPGNFRRARVIARLI